MKLEQLVRAVLCVVLGAVAAGQTLGAAALAQSAHSEVDVSHQLAHDIFKELVEIDTTHSAGSVTAASEAMRRRFVEGGFSPADLILAGSSPRKQNLIVRMKSSGGDGAILIFGHLDVVEARRADWTLDPFQFVEKSGYFYGRGTQDIKDNDALAIANLLRLQHEGYRPRHDLLLMLTADEEAGLEDGMDWLLQNRPELFRNVLFAINLDAGDVNLQNGKVVNVDYELSEKIYADFELTASDAGGHSSLPHPGNPIQRLADGLARLEAAKFPAELNPVTREYFAVQAVTAAARQKTLIAAALSPTADPSALEALADSGAFPNAMLRTTCIPTHIEGGHANNALPQSATANVNCRILPGHSPLEVEQHIKSALADAAVKFRYCSSQGHCEDASTGKGMPVVVMQPHILDALKQSVAALWPGVPVFGEMETGMSDTVYTARAGIPTYGISCVGIDEDDVRAHGKDERVRTGAFYAGVDLFYRLLKEVDNAASASGL